MVTKKSSSSNKGPKAAPPHPPYIDMIKECIADHHEEARIGVSRPQIKKYIEEKYKIEIGAAQTTQISRAITTGNDKGIFVLPKGENSLFPSCSSGRVKLAPKIKSSDSSPPKENKPIVKPKSTAAKKPVTKSTVSKTSTTKASAPSTKKAPAKTVSTKKSTAKPAVSKTAAAKPTTKPATAKKAPAKTVAAKKPTAKAPPAKKPVTKNASSTAKKAATGTNSTTKAKAAATKAKASTNKAKVSTAKAKAPMKRPLKKRA